MQGFGKVGRFAARFLSESGMKVIATSDQHGAIVDEAGLDIVTLEKHVDQTGSVVDFSGSDELDGNALLEADVDLLVPAAVEGVLRADNAERVRARVIVEGANGPTTPEADKALASKGVLVAPDILANAGGVVVSYFEWVQSSQSFWWSLAEVEARLRDHMVAAWADVNDASRRMKVSLRTAATALAVERVAQAHLQRGLYP